MEEASVMMTGVSIDRIIQAIDILSSQKRGSERTLKLVQDYDINNVSEKIVRIILSYTDYIKKKIYGKKIKKNMKILIVSQYFWPENFRVNELAEGLIKLGHKVTILTGYPNYPKGDIYLDFKKQPKKI